MQSVDLDCQIQSLSDKVMNLIKENGQLQEDNASLRRIVAGLASRVAAQSELLTRKAEKT